MGYYWAGFQVVGVDHKPFHRYPFEHVVGDAMEYLAAHGHEFDAIHASPPCQAYAGVTGAAHRSKHPDLLRPVRALLDALGKPYVIENVPEAPIRRDYSLCGTTFGLPVRRHRAFETNWVDRPRRPPCAHQDSDLPFIHEQERAYADAMECTWMTYREGRQAVPPAMTHWIGLHLMAELAGPAGGPGHV